MVIIFSCRELRAWKVTLSAACLGEKSLNPAGAARHEQRVTPHQRLASPPSPGPHGKDFPIGDSQHAWGEKHSSHCSDRLRNDMFSRGLRNQCNRVRAYPVCDASLCRAHVEPKIVKKVLAALDLRVHHLGYSWRDPCSTSASLSSITLFNQRV